MTAPLPRIPSQLIRLALADLRKVEAMSETYLVDMGPLQALDALRRGYVRAGLTWLNLAKPETIADEYFITPYARDPAAFKRDMERYASDLEAEGL